MNHFLLRVCAAAAVVFGTSSAAKAAPVMLAFEAEISSVSLGIPFDSGVDFAVGDTISGQFTFEPFEEDCAASGGISQPLGCTTTKEQISSFSVEIDGVTLTAPSFEIRASNNSGIEDFPPAGVIDMLELQGDGLTPIDSSNSVSINPATSAFRMILRGSTDLIDSASAPGTAAVWNQFQFERSLHITLRDGVGGAIGFRAEVGQLSIIPEPSCLCLASFALASFLYISSRNCR